MDFKDYYKILGVERAADAKTIKRAFRRLAREHHPDVNKKSGAEERFKEINEAYQVLGEEKKRAQYDQMLEAYQRGGVNWQEIFGRSGPFQQHPGRGGYTVIFGEEDLEGLGGFSEFFREFFGGGIGGGARAGRSGGRPARGGAQSRGRGFGDLYGDTAPPSSESTLEITLEEAFQGTRKSLQLQMDGSPRNLDVSIPKGVRTGQRIRLSGALDGGDLYLKVNVRPHPIFERRDDDIVVEVPVSLPDAMLGTEIQVPTLEGHVSMTVPPETQNGRVFRLRGLGMPRPDGSRGDQRVRIKVVLPDRLSDDERRFFEKMRKRRAEGSAEDPNVKRRSG